MINASAKSIDPGQPAQSAQADLGRNFLILVNFLLIKGPNYLTIHSAVKTKSRMRKAKACMTLRSNRQHSINRVSAHASLSMTYENDHIKRICYTNLRQQKQNRPQRPPDRIYNTSDLWGRGSHGASLGNPLPIS